MTRHAIITWFERLVDHDRPADGSPPQQLGAFFRWSLAGSFGVIGLGAVASASAGLVEVLMAYQLGVIVDAAVGAGGVTDGFWADHAAMILGWFAVLFLLRPGMFMASSAFQSVAVAPNIFKLVLARLHRYTLGQAVTFFDNDFAGRIAQKQMQTTRALVDVVTETMNAVSLAIASVLATAAIIGVINPLMAGIVAIWVVIYIIFLRFVIPRVRVLSAKRAAARAMVTGQVVDTITNIKTVKLFALTGHEDRAAIGAIDQFREAGLNWAQVAVFFRLGLVLIAGLLPATVVSLGLYMVAQGSATPGELTAMGAMAIRLAHMTGWVSWTLLGIYGNIGEVEDGMRTLAPPQDLTDSPDAETAGGKAEIHFDKVTFAYGREAGGVSGIDLKIQEGEKLGIVGASGAGKSTLVSLLLRLYDTEEGAVRVGGQDVRQVTQESLRLRIGMVTQETAMFNRSARENILYGRPNATDAQMIDAAKRARADDFIGGLQDFRGRTGYDAHLGERGVKLSGGQRQRIALARAILKDAPILVLDEATSALDSEVEAEIQAALEEVMQGKTVLAIAHRLSTIARMDRIIVMAEGRIVEEGTHADLLARNGTYARFWNRQSGGFLGLHEAAE